MAEKEKSRQSSEEQRGIPLGLTRVAWALSTVIGLLKAMQLISIPYFWTVILAYCLFVLSAIEVAREPSLKGPWRIVGFIFVAAGTVWFTVVGPFATAPLKVLVHTTPGNYPSGTNIGEIPWDSHFTDLRISVSNPSPDDYHDADILFRPDAWTYKATIVTTPPECELIRVAGDSDIHVVNSSQAGSNEIQLTFDENGYEAYTNGGDIFGTFASQGGYRLRCTTLPSHYTVQIAFALIDPAQLQHSKDTLHEKAFSLITPRGSEQLQYEELSGGSPFGRLGPRPPCATVFMDSSYVRGIKPYKISRTLGVGGKEDTF